MAKRCETCSMVYDESSNQCPYCGSENAKIEAVQNSQPVVNTGTFEVVKTEEEAPKKGKKALIIIVVAILLTIAAIVGAVLYVTNNKDNNTTAAKEKTTKEIVTLSVGDNKIENEKLNNYYPIVIEESGYYIVDIDCTCESSDSKVFAKMKIDDEEAEPMKTRSADDSSFTDKTSMVFDFETDKEIKLYVWADSETDAEIKSLNITVRKPSNLTEGSSDTADLIYYFEVKESDYYMLSCSSSFEVDDESSVSYVTTYNGPENHIYAKYFEAEKTYVVMPSSKDAITYETISETYCEGVAIYRNYKTNGLYATSKTHFEYNTRKANQWAYFYDSGYKYPVGFVIVGNKVWLSFGMDHSDYGGILVYYAISIS